VILVDTSGLLCALAHDEPGHSLAEKVFRSLETKLTHSYVLAELVILARVRGYAMHEVLGFAADLLHEPLLEIVWVGESLHTAAILLLGERADKAYSLCDAVSFVLMRERRISEALTTDHHFTQEGFTRLIQYGTS
jgi:uncharacterized protein